MFVQETPQKRDKSFASPFQNWIFNAISWTELFIFYSTLFLCDVNSTQIHKIEIKLLKIFFFNKTKTMKTT